MDKEGEIPTHVYSSVLRKLLQGTQSSFHTTDVQTCFPHLSGVHLNY